MWTLLLAIADLLSFGQSLREERRSGRWTPARLLFLLGFVVLELGLILFALLLPDRLFVPCFFTGLGIAMLNFFWFVPVVRRFSDSPGAPNPQG